MQMVAKLLPPSFPAEIGKLVWDAKYRWRDGASHPEPDIEATWRRVAHTLAAAEPVDRRYWAHRFYEALADFRFMPGGRVLAGAGTGRRVTLFNCFVMGTIEDSLDGMARALNEGVLTMQEGGGVGYDFSTLRPAGSAASHPVKMFSGPVSFLRVWDAMCATIESTSARRGAMMGTLRCDHLIILTSKPSSKQSASGGHCRTSICRCSCPTHSWPPSPGAGSGSSHSDRRTEQST